MFPSEVHNLRHFGLGDLVSEDTALADPMLVNVHHDALCRLVVLAKETLEHVHDKLHRCVVVVKQEDAIEVRPLGLRPCLGDNRGARAVLIAFALPIIVCHAGWN